MKAQTTWTPDESEIKELEDAFPSLSPQHTPFGDRIIFQLKLPKEKTAGGIILPEDVKENAMWSTQVAKVISIGPGAFKFHTDMTPWPEGPWFAEGDYVRIPMYGSERWLVEQDGKKAVFVIRRSHEVIAKVNCNPLRLKEFL